MLPELDQLANLRRQCEALAREQQLYQRKVRATLAHATHALSPTLSARACCTSAQSPYWIDWTDVQVTRQNAIKAFQAAPLSKKEAVLRDVLVIVLHSITCVSRASFRPDKHGLTSACGACAQAAGQCAARALSNTCR